MPDKRLDPDPLLGDGRSTSASQSSPASTVTSAPAQALAACRTPASGDPDDDAVEAGVGDHQVAAAAEHQDRLVRLVGSGNRGVEVVAGGGLHPAAPPVRRAAASSSAASRSTGASVTRTTARHTPSTFWSSLVTVTSIVALPSSTDFTTPAAVDDGAVVVVRHDDRLGEPSAERLDCGDVADPGRRRRGWPARACTCRARSRRATSTDVATRSLQWIGLKSPEAPA